MTDSFVHVFCIISRGILYTSSVSFLKTGFKLRSEHEPVTDGRANRHEDQGEESHFICEHIKLTIDCFMSKTLLVCSDRHTN